MSQQKEEDLTISAVESIDLVHRALGKENQELKERVSELEEIASLSSSEELYFRSRIENLEKNLEICRQENFELKDQISELTHQISEFKKNLNYSNDAPHSLVGHTTTNLPSLTTSSITESTLKFQSSPLGKIFFTPFLPFSDLRLDNPAPTFDTPMQGNNTPTQGNNTPITDTLSATQYVQTGGSNAQSLSNHSINYTGLEKSHSPTNSTNNQDSYSNPDLSIYKSQ